MKVSDYIAQYLKAQGIQEVFEVIGGMITHIIDSISKVEGVKIFSMHHEQGAAFAAEGSARQSGVPGVALATSGPGATNLLTGIGSCYFDSVPAVFITGQVNRHEQKAHRDIRQLGFQETDIVSMAKPITKGAWLVQSAEELPGILQKAFELAISGRPGPVLIDIPLDVQRLDIQVGGEIKRVHPLKTNSVCPSSEIASAIKNAKRPLILAGGGIRASGACHLFRQFVDLVQVPVVCSLMGVDAIESTHPLKVGLIGSYGNRWANTALANADFLLVVGSRLDVRQTGSETEAFTHGKTIYHVDCEAGEINNRVKGCISVLANLDDFFKRLIEDASYFIASNFHGNWKFQIETWRNFWPDTDEIKNVVGINPNVFCKKLSVASEAAEAFVTDVGQHQMWAAQSLVLNARQRFLTSGGMGAMGFSLPAAIGCAIACKKPVVVLAGDGGFQLNIQELQTVIRNRLPVKIVILNNHCHGMVRQFQQTYFEEKYHSTLWGYSAPDFAKVAEAYGLESMTISDINDIDGALTRLWEREDEPFLLQVMIDTFANAYPKMAFGHPIDKMEPMEKSSDMEGT